MTEQWKTVTFDFDYVNELRVEVSDHGNIRSFSNQTNGEILKGSMIKGYRILRFKFFKKINPALTEKLIVKRQEINALRKSSGLINKKLKAKKRIDEQYHELTNSLAGMLTELEKLRADYKKYKRKIDLRRTINVGMMVHKAVAEQFIHKPSPQHTIVSHLNYDKLNNRASNLAWMTHTENVAHQQKSPHVLAARKARIGKRFKDAKTSKLTVHKVMLLKKKIENGQTIRSLSRTFKITETQILRIKRGINWGDIKPAN